MSSDDQPASRDPASLHSSEAGASVAASHTPVPGFAWWHPGHLHWIADRNPFYLLSAVCLILGCWLLGHTSQSLPGLSALIAGLVAYELLAVPLALWLARQRAFGRDAAIVSVLVIFLAADFTFFYSQAATERQDFAQIATLFGAAQSLAVVGWLLRGFGVRLTQAGQWILAADFLAIHLMPLAMRLLSDKANMALALLGVAVATGLLLALHGLPARWRHPEMAAGESRRLTRALAWLAPAVALASLAAHGASVQWVYDIRFGGAHLAPLALGGAALLLGLERKNLWPAGLAIQWAGALAVLGVLLTLGDDMGLTWNVLREQTWLGLSPMRGATLAAAALLWCAWRMNRHKVLLFLATCASGLFLLGHSMKVAMAHVGLLWDWLGRTFSVSVPTTRAGWGVVLFVGAFVLLGVGALISRLGARKRALPAVEKEAGHA